MKSGDKIWIFERISYKPSDEAATYIWFKNGSSTYIEQTRSTKTTPPTLSTLMTATTTLSTPTPTTTCKAAGKLCVFDRIQLCAIIYFVITYKYIPRHFEGLE